MSITKTLYLLHDNGYRAASFFSTEGKLPEWAADILFPPLRSILVLPGEEGKIVEAGALGRSIHRQLHADHLDCVGDCSENESINIYCDQDAKTKGLPFNRCLHGMNYYGPILINGMHEEDRSLTDLEIANLLPGWAAGVLPL